MDWDDYEQPRQKFRFTNTEKAFDIVYDITKLIAWSADIVTDIVLVSHFIDQGRNFFFTATPIILICFAQIGNITSIIRQCQHKSIKICCTAVILAPLLPALIIIFNILTRLGFCSNTITKLASNELFEILSGETLMPFCQRGSAYNSRQAPLLVWFGIKRNDHIPFIIQACIESVPMIVIQFIGIVLDRSRNINNDDDDEYNVSNIQILSFVLSLINVIVNGLLLCDAFDFKVVFFKLLATVTDVIGMITICLWIIYDADQYACVHREDDIDVWSGIELSYWTETWLVIMVTLICVIMVLLACPYCIYCVYFRSWMIFIIIFCGAVPFVIIFCIFSVFSYPTGILNMKYYSQFNNGVTSIFAKKAFDFILYNKDLSFRDKTKTINDNKDGDLKLSKTKQEILFRLFFINYCYVKFFEFKKRFPNKEIELLNDNINQGHSWDNIKKEDLTLVSNQAIKASMIKYVCESWTLNSKDMRDEMSWNYTHGWKKAKKYWNLVFCWVIHPFMIISHLFSWFLPLLSMMYWKWSINFEKISFKNSNGGSYDHKYLMFQYGFTFAYYILSVIWFILFVKCVRYYSWIIHVLPCNYRNGDWLIADLAKNKARVNVIGRAYKDRCRMMAWKTERLQVLIRRFGSDIGHIIDDYTSNFSMKEWINKLSKEKTFGKWV